MDKIWKSNLKNLKAEELTDLVRVPLGLAIDHQEGKLYFSSAAKNGIGKINFDGSGRQKVVSTSLTPVGIAIYHHNHMNEEVADAHEAYEAMKSMMTEEAPSEDTMGDQMEHSMEHSMDNSMEGPMELKMDEEMDQHHEEHMTEEEMKTEMESVDDEIESIEEQIETIKEMLRDDYPSLNEMKEEKMME
jgi:ATP-dependent Lon protease